MSYTGPCWAAAPRYAHYESCVQKGQFGTWWRRFRGETTALAKFEDVARQVNARQQQAKRLESVPLAHIVGSVGRARDFTCDFWPCPSVNKERWAGIDAALTAGLDLPPVELYQIGEVYFVNDGNHRTSVARANGLQEIAAYVTKLESHVPLTVEDFRRERWRGKGQPPRKEPSMIVPDHIPFELAKPIHEARAQEIQAAWQTRQISTGRPVWQERLALGLGNLLIALGNRLKAQSSAS
jgi:hypothetical protein